MRRNYRSLVGRAVCAALLLTGAVQAQEHRWAGRTLDKLEWAVHERLASLPMRGAFETVNFEVDGSQVTLSGQVLRESLKEKAESAVRDVGGVTRVVNKVEVLPQSKRDDVLRMNVYRAIYEKDASDTAGSPEVHIIVRHGWVTLEGIVDSESARTKIHKQALGITAHVSDQLRVAPQPEPAALAKKRSLP